MRVVCLHDRQEIAGFLLRSPALHLYAIGDLDEFFWPYTTWYAQREDDRQDGPVQQLILVYTGTSLPTLLALSEPPFEPLRDLLRSTQPFLPRRFYAHMSGNLAEVFSGEYNVYSYGQHYKMVLAYPERLDLLDASIPDAGQVTQLVAADLPALQALYEASYPGNWFDPRMLKTGCYYGIRNGTEILSVAGIHVYSPRYRVATLGNITTHPAHRGRGLCTSVTARLCQVLRREMDFIGLNVKADNAAAIHCYEKLGFERAGEYEEYMIEIF